MLYSILHYSALMGIIWAIKTYLPLFWSTLWFIIFASTFLLFLGVLFFFIPIIFKLLKNWLYEKPISDTRNKCVLITGCDSGFGNTLAKKLDTEGFRVFASCLYPSGPGAEELKNSTSSRLHILSLDVRNEGSIEAAVSYVTKHLGNDELWAIVNNAGIQKGFHIDFTTMQEFSDCLDVNTLGVIRVTKAFLPLLRRSKGRVVTMTSITGRISFPYFSAYGISKYAVTCFCECLRQEIRPWGIKVISIEPELFKTPLTNTEIIAQNFQQGLENCNDYIHEIYGKKYFEGFQKYLTKNVEETSSRNTDPVIKDVVKSVCLENPRDVYKPCRHKLVSLIIYFMERLPRPLLDEIFYFHSYVTKFPMPKFMK